jgi:hypothetical protein
MPVVLEADVRADVVELPEHPAIATMTIAYSAQNDARVIPDATSCRCRD